MALFDSPGTALLELLLSTDLSYSLTEIANVDRYNRFIIKLYPIHSDISKCITIHESDVISNNSVPVHLYLFSIYFWLSVHLKP